MIPVPSGSSIRQFAFITAEDQGEFEEQFITATGSLMGNIPWSQVEDALLKFSLPEGAVPRIWLVD